MRVLKKIIFCGAITIAALTLLHTTINAYKAIGPNIEPTDDSGVGLLILENIDF